MVMQLPIITLAVAIVFTIIAVASIIETPSGMVAEPLPPADSSIIAAIFKSSPYIAPLAWAAFLGALIWKGKIRSLWHQKGYDYDEFKILVKMRGSDTRVKILRNVTTVPKSKLQIANELEMDWKSIDGHVRTLADYSLVKEAISFGTATYFVITDRGKEVLDLLDNGKAAPT